MIPFLHIFASSALTVSNILSLQDRLVSAPAARISKSACLKPPPISILTLHFEETITPPSGSAASGLKIELLY